jgi:hypothetical protein
MFVKEFFFSFSLLAFTGLLMIAGIVLLLDALRRFAVDAFKTLRPKVTRAPAVVLPLSVVKKSEDKLPTLEEAA